jgi:heat-inducible transcriptional repressor
MRDSKVVGAIPDLTERRQQILRVVIHEYIAGARPVGSETLVARHQLGVSAATVRNELAVLEQLGLIHQLHTSAGRVPSDEGYRYYVEHLMEEPVLSSEEQRTIDHQFHQVQLELNEWMHLTAAIMSRAAQVAALVTAPRAYQSKLKHVELISIHETLALLVAVFHGGNLQQQMFVLPELLNQNDLREASVRLNKAFEGLTLAGVEARRRDTLEMPELDVLVYGHLVKMMRTMDEQANGPVHYDGLPNILNQPEFSSAVTTRDGRQRQLEHIVDIIQLVQQGILFNSVLPQVAESGGVQVIIGGEGGREELRQYSMILSRYGVSEEVSGVLGVFGPTRMQYGRAISIVRYMTHLMTSLAREIYGARHE